MLTSLITSNYITSKLGITTIWFFVIFVEASIFSNVIYAQIILGIMIAAWLAGYIPSIKGIPENRRRNKQIREYSKYFSISKSEIKLNTPPLHRLKLTDGYKLKLKLIEDNIICLINDHNTIPTLNEDDICIGYKCFSFPIVEPVMRKPPYLKGSFSDWKNLTFNAQCTKGSVRNHLLNLRNCGCGIYSYSSLKYLSEGHWPDNSSPFGLNVVGEVVNWGAVVPHSRGFKSENSRITRLWVVSEDINYGKAQEGLIKLRYGMDFPVEVISYSKFMEMVREEETVA